MENLQRLASKNLRFCLQTFNNCLTSSINRNLVTLTTTRQPKDLVEIANSTTSKQSTTNITQRRQFTLSTQFLSNIFNIQDDKDFKERVLNSNKPVVVDFHATWCQPCKILAPRLEQILATYEGKADFAKVDIDKHTDLAFDYNVFKFSLY